MSPPQTIITSSTTQTKAAPNTLFPSLKPGTVLALSGELGSGKTTFTQGLAQSLDVSKRITSPTFVLLKQYQTPKIPGLFFHLDLYRIDSIDQILSLDLPSLFAENIHIFAIEWPKPILHILPQSSFFLKFTILSEKKRQIQINNRLNHELTY